jgi:hypothetical protein
MKYIIFVEQIPFCLPETDDQNGPRKIGCLVTQLKEDLYEGT